jgi:hypothetical protein
MRMMNTKKEVESAMRIFLIALACLWMSSAHAQQATREAQVGLLNCTVEGGTDARPSETYLGEIKKFGIDIGRTQVSKLSWAVFAPSKSVEDFGRLTGSYGGVSGEVTVGVGLGANILVGGFDKSIALQPLSLQAQTGLNIAAGISSLELRVP